MNCKAVIVALFLLAPLSAHAGDKWDSVDLGLFAGFQALTLVDYAQTRHITDNPNRFYERNKILGTHPDAAAVAHYFVARNVLMWGVAEVLPSDFRKLFLGSSIGLQFYYVQSNYRLGVKLEY